MENLTKLNLDNYKPLRDVVFENLREAILEGKLKPGQRLMEVQLAEQLGVSRTPVREAIRKLELEGLVVMLPRKGAYVANMSLKDIMDVLEVRASLEGLAAYLAAERISDEDIKKLKDISEEFKKSTLESDVDALLKLDVEFHECIFKATNNKKLIQLINSLWEQVYRF
ncbi:GntR family transcriptional regulator, partial [Clostridioides difficile]